MIWHVGGKHLKSEEVPVLDILKEFRALAGIEGRMCVRVQRARNRTSKRCTILSYTGWRAVARSGMAHVIRDSKRGKSIIDATMGTVLVFKRLKAPQLYNTTVQ